MEVEKCFKNMQTVDSKKPPGAKAVVPMSMIFDANSHAFGSAMKSE
jgi:hypothetical protein